MARARTLVLDTKVNVTGADQLRGLGRTLQQTGGLLTVGLTLPLIGLGASMLTAAQDAERAQAKLSNTFRSMGAAAFTSVEALNAHAEALQNATTFDDESINEAQAVLLTFGNITGKAFTRATEAALDLTSLFEGDLQSATIQIGKALNDPITGITALTRVGVSFTEQQKEQIKVLQESGDLLGAQTIILEELERQFGGTAEALAGTAGGQMTQAFNQLNDAAEEFGEIIAPVLVDVANGLKDFAKWLRELNPETREWVVRIGLLAAALGPLLIVVGSLIRTFAILAPAIRFFAAADAVTGVSRLSGAFSALAGAASSAASVLGSAASAVGSTFSAAFSTAASAVGSLASSLGGALSAAGGALRNAVVGAATAIGSAFSAAFNAAASVLAPVTTALKGLAQRVAVTAAAAGTALGAAFSAAFEVAATAVAGIGQAIGRTLRGAGGLVLRAATLLGAMFGAAFEVAVNVAEFVVEWSSHLFKFGRARLFGEGTRLGALFGGAFAVASAAGERILTFAQAIWRAGRGRVVATGAALGGLFGGAFTAAAATRIGGLVAAVGRVLGPLGLLTGVLVAGGAAGQQYGDVLEGLSGKILTDFARQHGIAADQVDRDVARISEALGVDIPEAQKRLLEGMDGNAGAYSRIVNDLTGVTAEAAAALTGVTAEAAAAWDGLRAGTAAAVGDLGGDIEEMVEIVGRAPGALANELRAGIDDYDEALAELTDVAVNSVSDLAERQKIEGILASQQLTDALNSDSTRTRLLAADLVTDLVSDYELLAPGALGAGRLVNPALAQGLTSNLGLTTTAARAVRDAAGNQLVDLGEQAFGWGSSLSANFMAGMSSYIGAIRATSIRLGDAAATGIRLRSPAKDGPLSEPADVWGRLLGLDFAKGLRESIGAVKGASLAVAGAAVLSGSVSDGLRALPSLSPAVRGAGVVNNFYLRWDGEPPKGRNEEEIIGNLQRLSPLVGNALVGGS